MLCTFYSCSSDPHSAAWEFLIDPGLLEKGNYLEAVIYKGGCDWNNDTDMKLYQAFMERGNIGPDINTLEKNRYGFVGKIRDEKCELIGVGCIPIDLPSDGTIQVPIQSASQEEINRDNKQECEAEFCQGQPCSSVSSLPINNLKTRSVETTSGAGGLDTDPIIVGTIKSPSKKTAPDNIDKTDNCPFDCSMIPHAETTCRNQQCIIEDCEQGWIDCDKGVFGCETQLGTIDNCNGCEDKCQELPYTISACVDGTCHYVGCYKGWANCDDECPDCETQLGTLENCGGCGDECIDLPQTIESCIDNQCSIQQCEDGWADCLDDQPGCETLLGTPSDCSNCGDSCLSRSTYSTQKIVNADCIENKCQILQCDEHFADCNYSIDDGCETQLGTHENCSGCGDDCSSLDGGFCIEGSCYIDVCASGSIDCDSTLATGCEATDSTCYRDFGYQPSNFDPHVAEIAPHLSSSLKLECGNRSQIWFNYASDTGQLEYRYTNWCNESFFPIPSVQSQENGPDIVVIPVWNFILGANSQLEFDGNLPVLIAVYGDAIIDGEVNASAKLTHKGVGGNIYCLKGAGETGLSGLTSCGGGGGGGFGSFGGDGGSGLLLYGGIGGEALGNEQLIPLRGGCPGGSGGIIGDTWELSTQLYSGGGGGAVQISAAGKLSVHGTIAASGGGGEAAFMVIQTSCGGGGGSGGGILLEGSTVFIADTAWVTANGGGGGGGGPNSMSGEDGHLNDEVCAAGGMGSGDGGKGETSNPVTLDSGQDGETNLTYGGGGGGSVGRIRINAHQSCQIAGIFSPTASTNGCESL